MSPHPASRPERIALIALLITVALQLLLRGLWLSPSSLNVDESFFAACAVRANAEHAAPLMACIDNKSPGVFLLYQIVFMFSGAYNMFAIHLAGMLWTFATAIAIHFAARELGGNSGGRSAGYWAAALYLILTAGDYRLLATKSELLAALPLSLSVWLFARALRLRSLRTMLSAGAALGCAICFKQPTLLLAGAFLGILALMLVLPDKRDVYARIDIVKHGVTFAAGIALVLGAVALAYALAGGLGDLLYQTIEYPSLYATVNTTSPLQRLLKLASSLDEYSRLAPYCWLAGLLGATLSLREREADGPAALRWLPAFTILAMLAAISLGKGFYLAYYIFLFPMLAISGSLFMQTATRSGAVLRRAALLMAVLTLLSNAILIGKDPLKRWLTHDNTVTHSRISQRINALSAPDDSLYVWGFAPDYFVETRLVGASKVLLSDHLQGIFAETDPKIRAEDRKKLVKPELWTQFMNDLQKHPPAFFIDISPKPLRDAEAITFSPDNYPQLRDYLQTHCKTDLAEGGVQLHLCNRLAPPR